MELVKTACAICNSFDDYTVLYKKNFDEPDLTADVFSARRVPDKIHYRIVRCNKDRLIRSNPVLAESALRALYEKSRFTYADEVSSLSKTYLGALRPLLEKLPKAAKILEVGCGNGFLLKELYGMGYKELRGIEPSLDAAAKGHEIIRDKIMTGVLEPGTFKAGQFGLIYFFQLLDHLPDPGGFLRTCYDILEPGGFVLAFNHDIQSPQARLLGERSPVIDIEHSYLFNRETIKKIFEKNGFLPLKIYSPANEVSLRHMVRMIPMPKKIKMRLVEQETGIGHFILAKRINIRLGNLCIIATKERA